MAQVAADASRLEQDTQRKLRLWEALFLKMLVAQEQRKLAHNNGGAARRQLANTRNVQVAIRRRIVAAKMH